MGRIIAKGLASIVLIAGLAACDDKATLSPVNEPPSFAADGGFLAAPSSGPVPLSVSFQSTVVDADGDALTFTYDFGDGSPTFESPDGNADHSYTTEGAFTATLLVEDARGALASQTIVISAGVGSNKPPTVSAVATPTTGTAPLNVTFGGAAVDADGSVVSYSWAFGDGGTAPSANAVHTYNSNGVYVATLSATDDKGAIGTDTVIIVVNVGLPASPTGLTATSISTGRIDLQWTDNASNEQGFTVERSSGAGFSTIATLGPNVTTFQNTGLPSYTTFQYRVRAFNGAGSSGTSNTASARTKVSFSANVDPLFLVPNPRGSQATCTSCHSGGSGGMTLTGSAANDFAELRTEISPTTGTVRARTDAPTSSLILRKPTLDGFTHSGGQLWLQSDPQYQTVLDWLSEGGANN